MRNSRYTICIILIFLTIPHLIFAQQILKGTIKYLENRNTVTKKTRLVLYYQEENQQKRQIFSSQKNGIFEVRVANQVKLENAELGILDNSYFLLGENNVLLDNNTYYIQNNPQNISLLLVKANIKGQAVDDTQKPIEKLRIFNPTLSEDNGNFNLLVDCQSMKVPLIIGFEKQGYERSEIRIRNLQDIENIRKISLKYTGSLENTENPVNVIPNDSTTPEVVKEATIIKENLENLEKAIDEAINEENIDEQKLSALRERAEKLKNEITNLKKEVEKLGPEYEDLLKDSEAKDQTIQKLLGRLEIQERELEFRRVQNTYSFILILGLLLMLIFIFRNRQVTHKKNKELQEKNEQIQFLIDEMEHRVGNNLKNIASILNMRSSKAQNIETKEALQNMHNVVQAMHFLHQDLSYNEKQEKIDLSAYLNKLSLNLKKVLLPRNPSVDFQIDIQESIMVNNRQAMDLALIVNELLTNAFKHAFEGIKNPQLMLKLWENEEEIKLMVKDNGIGANPDKIKQSNRLGIKLVNGFGNKMKAKFAIENKNGLECLFSFDKQIVNANKNDRKTKNIGA